MASYAAERYGQAVWAVTVREQVVPRSWTLAAQTNGLECRRDSRPGVYL